MQTGAQLTLPSYKSSQEQLQQKIAALCQNQFPKHIAWSSHLTVQMRWMLVNRSRVRADLQSHLTQLLKQSGSKLPWLGQGHLFM
jgi:hypothetical protein